MVIKYSTDAHKDWLEFKNRLHLATDNAVRSGVSSTEIQQLQVRCMCWYTDKLV